ncbi:hypothetical protein M7I_5915 [Glarea lozoyensis 74030]|uniref:Uncharacterized protein n=1 Tax=Glarea lozoyensis (strain ATCC 74030 / MF5533) TaxID=1104152 RepID=H0ET60_GLAL7|nr:hypothetical protein M7I_5915 [Glarea lozoyensis 74030]
MGWEGLKGMYLNGHIRELLEERDEERKGKMNGKTKAEEDSVVKMLGVSVEQAKKAFEAVEQALEAYKRNTSGKVSGIGSVRENGIGSRALIGEMGGDTVDVSEGETRRGVTSREMSGEMGGDTIVV